MKKVILLPAATAVFALAGFFLRRWQLATAWEEPGGFVKPGAPANVVLVAVLAVGAVTCLLMSARCAGHPSGYLEGFQTSRIWAPIPFVFAGVAITRSGVLGILNYRQDGELGVLYLLLSVVFVVMGLTAAWMGFVGRSRTPLSDPERVGLMIPGFGCCLWLVQIYQIHTADPERMNYIFLLLGAAAGILALYTMAGFAFEKRPRAVRCSWYLALAVIFLVTDLADGRDAVTLGVEIGLAVFFLTQQTILTLRAQFPAQVDDPETTQETGESDT